MHARRREYIRLDGARKYVLSLNRVEFEFSVISFDCFVYFSFFLILKYMHESLAFLIIQTAARV